jgi:hypothetical protein
MNRRIRVAAAVVAALILAPAGAARAATVTVINRDGPGEGFNDPTPMAPTGGNIGTTLGAQRLIAFQHAADLWGVQLDSAVEIRVSATFDPLGCDSQSVTLGMAGPVSVFRDFTGAPLPNTYYPSALADSLAGMDLAPDEDDIEASFNSVFGTTCSFPASWYYGLDGAPPGQDTDFVTVVLHELGHGLGFLTLVDINSGQLFDNRNDVFLLQLLDNRTGKTFDQMSNGERASASKATGHLVWNGGAVTAASDVLVEMYAPNPPESGSSVSHWSDAVQPHQLMAPFFEGVVHDVGLAAPLMRDIGWNLLSGVCAADCNGDGRVTIDELILQVRIALGEANLDDCLSADANGSGTIEVNELVGAVNRALDGCPSK